MSGAEEVKPYGEERPKGEQVEAMFDSIAPAYDLMNAAMTFGLHRRWLGTALKAIKGRGMDAGTMAIIDLATGTGDVALRLAREYPEAAITGVDLSEGMLEVARTKAADKGLESRIDFMQADCLDLPFPDDSFSLLTIAYGVRNFENLRRGFREFHRVLRPGGVCMILELSRPENRIVRPLYDIYSRTLIPLAGRLVSRDRRAYSYLPESIAAMPPRREIKAMLEEAGFRNVSFRSLTMGVVTYYIAEK